MNRSSPSHDGIEQNTPLIQIATQNVVCLLPTDHLGTAAKVMAEKRISSIVVCDENAHPLGIVTERNVLHAMQSAHPPELLLQETMSSPVITVGKSATCFDAYQISLRNGIRHLVIVGDDKRLLGVVSETDFRRHLDLTALAGRRKINSLAKRTAITLPPSTPLMQALDLMQTQRKSCVVVTENEKPVGIVTERDVVRFYSRKQAYADIMLSAVMAAPVLTIPHNATTNQAAEKMLDHKVRHLVVVNETGHMAGLLEEHEIAQAMVSGLIEERDGLEESFLHTLVNTLPDLVWLKDVEGVYLACNARFERFFGARENDILGKTDYDFVSAELADLFRKHDRNAMRAGKPSVNEEWVTYADDGHRELLETIKTPMHGRNGKLIGVLGIARDITDRKRTEELLLKQKQFSDDVINNLPGIFYMLDKQGCFVRVNPQFLDVSGYSHAELVGQSALAVISKKDSDAVGERIQEVFEKGKASIEADFVTKSGQNIPYFFSGDLTYIDGQPYLIGLGTDITARKRAEENLRITASVFDNTQDAVIITDAENIIIDVNPAFTRITGYEREEAIGRNPRLLSSGRQSKDFYAAMRAALKEKKAWRGEVWNRRKSGEIYAELLSISAICDSSGNPQRHVGVFSDISYLKEHEAELSRVANYDVLTGIPNRRLLADRLRQAVVHAQRNNKMLAICYIDLDGFKDVNDRLGHEAGDQLLVGITRRLQEVLRAGDTLARLGGDEFVLLFNDLSQEKECLQVLDRIMPSIAMPMLINKQQTVVSASIGVTFYPADNADGDTLLRHADQAMYVAKQSGKNRYHLYDAAHDQRVRSLHESRRRILQGLENNEFELYYQPKLELATGKVVGVEALIRWHHPEQGLLLPSEFLPFIDDSDLEIHLGEWVIDTALAQLHVWSKEGGGLEISVNISAHHLQSPGFISWLKERLAKYPGLPHNKLQIEVLETAALENIAKSSEMIGECRKLGVNFALDDFGTGYSSLAYLRKLSAETLKIDLSFVQGMLTNEGDRAIVQGIVALAKTFGCKTVAEGMEAEGMEAEELTRMLLEVGCIYGQGYGIARPMPAADFLKWEEERR